VLAKTDIRQFTESKSISDSRSVENSSETKISDVSSVQPAQKNESRKRSCWRFKLVSDSFVWSSRLWRHLCANSANVVTDGWK